MKAPMWILLICLVSLGIFTIVAACGDDDDDDDDDDNDDNDAGDDDDDDAGDDDNDTEDPNLEICTNMGDRFIECLGDEIFESDDDYDAFVQSCLDDQNTIDCAAECANIEECTPYLECIYQCIDPES